jgi:hypothetical protein
MMRKLLASLIFAALTLCALPAQADPTCTTVGVTETCIFSQTGTGQTWTVPANWNNVNTEYCIGGAGNGGVGAATVGGSGGGSSGETSASNVVLVPNATVNYQVGLGAGTTGASGTGATWFNGTSVSNASCGFSGGGGGPNGGTSGGAAAGVTRGTVVFASATGGLGGTGLAGGGGAAPGNNGSNGGAANGGAGGNGGPNSNGGAGATTSTPAGSGTPGTDITTVGTGAGNGGGGGGGTVTTDLSGGNGGAYGAAGGGAFHLGTAGLGAQGVIVVVFNPIVLHQLLLTGVGN